MIGLRLPSKVAIPRINNRDSCYDFGRISVAKQPTLAREAYFF
jgi:hypothetical protein